MTNSIKVIEKNKIDSICTKYGIENYKINLDGSIDVNGSVDLAQYSLSEIPLKFNNVSGDFYCCDNNLTTLVGAPTTVGGNFNCGHNILSNLEGAPHTVGGDCFMTHCSLTSLFGGPKEVIGGYIVSNNHLTTLEGAPDSCHLFSCDRNLLSSLIGAPSRITEFFSCEHNHLLDLVGVPLFIGGDLYISDNSNMTSLHSGDVDIELMPFKELICTGTKLPRSIRLNMIHIHLILKYQRYFMIWDANYTLNVNNFNDLITEINDGLE